MFDLSPLMDSKRQDRNRGQTYTLEAVIGSILLLTTVAFVFSSVTVTPLTSSTSNEQVGVQNSLVADDVLDVAVEKGVLTDTLLYYNTDETKFKSATDDGWYGSAPPTNFGTLLEKGFSGNVVYNIYVTYQTPSNSDSVTKRLVYQGTPASSAVSASRTVFLYDGMEITTSGNDNTIKEANKFYIKDASDGELYNVVTVRIVIWEL